MPRFIGVVSGKGGVGKTTLVTNLSVALASEFSKKVSVIDCNITTPHLAMHFGLLFQKATLNDVLKGGATFEEAMYEHSSGVKVIPASLNLTDLVGVNILNLSSSLNDFFEEDDFVILDSAPGFGKEAISALKACKEALIIATPDVPSIVDAIRLKNILSELEVHPLGLVLNKVTGKKYELNDNEITQLTGLPILAKIPFDPKIQESLTAKIPLVIYDPKRPTSREFFRLAAFLAAEEFKPKLSFFERIRRIFGI